MTEDTVEPVNGIADTWLIRTRTLPGGQRTDLLLRDGVIVRYGRGSPRPGPRCWTRTA